MVPVIESLIPDAGAIRSHGALLAVLRRIDGWGPLAWREVLGAWALPVGVIVIGVPDVDDGPADEDERHVVLALDRGPLVGRGAQDSDGDWVLRWIHGHLIPGAPIAVRTLAVGSAVRQTNAVWREDNHICMRMCISLPYAGMGIDSKRFRRFLRHLTAAVTSLVESRLIPGLSEHRRSVARQQALRAALPAAGLVAFIADGALLPRDETGGPARSAIPLSIPAALRCTLDLGPHGKIDGWGVKRGITALVGAPYHGKSTILQAIQAGIDDHPPHDGRELVVTDPSAVMVQAEDGRRIKDQDATLCFAALPGADPAHLTTERASGATSMAASALQAVAAGCRLLLIDEDTAAGNVLHIDPMMRALLGDTLDGMTTLSELLPGLATLGVSTILVAGSTGHLVANADTVVQLDHWQPHDVTHRVRRLMPRRRSDSHPSPVSVPVRQLRDRADALQGPRAFLACDLRDVERPRVRLPDGWTTLDLRRSGWVLDEGIVAGALAAAGWLCRMADGRPRDLGQLAEDFTVLIARGATALDPFHGRLLAVPPWQLVVSVLERLRAPVITGARSEKDEK